MSVYAISYMVGSENQAEDICTSIEEVRSSVAKLMAPDRDVPEKILEFLSCRVTDYEFSQHGMIVIRLDDWDHEFLDPMCWGYFHIVNEDEPTGDDVIEICIIRQQP